MNKVDLFFLKVLNTETWIRHLNIATSPFIKTLTLLSIITASAFTYIAVSYYPQHLYEANNLYYDLFNGDIVTFLLFATSIKLLAFLLLYEINFIENLLLKGTNLINKKAPLLPSLIVFTSISVLNAVNDVYHVIKVAI